MSRSLALTGLMLLAIPLSTAAEAKTFCGGAIVADRFDIAPPPGPGAPSPVSVTLRNTQTAGQRFQLVVSPGGFSGTLAPPTNYSLGRLESRSFPMGSRRNMDRVEQSPPVLPYNFENVLTITCY